MQCYKNLQVDSHDIGVVHEFTPLESKGQWKECVGLTNTPLACLGSGGMVEGMYRVYEHSSCSFGE